MKTYVTFGQDHLHQINGKILDKDTVAIINSSSPQEGRSMAFDLFGPKFAFEYPETHWDESSMRWYPKGYVEVN